MNSYYAKLPDLKVNYVQHTFGGMSFPEPKIFNNCEYLFTGDFAVILQERAKTIIPLRHVDKIEYPYESKPESSSESKAD